MAKQKKCEEIKISVACLFHLFAFPNYMRSITYDSKLLLLIQETQLLYTCFSLILLFSIQDIYQTT